MGCFRMKSVNWTRDVMTAMANAAVKSTIPGVTCSKAKCSRIRGVKSWGIKVALIKSHKKLLIYFFSF
ncbi:hypothetical protein C5167_032354 [Papaver somniferum]|uniref:Uncharacterized protein n=1 Tax=Papaver somniferum TaxID=3469 RepID=A0A4Y7K5E8_PAPSO|nr:hypothetical protein C5167_032354 [Papaver somniferum]